MLIKFGSIVTEASGKLGGHLIQHSKGGNQLRTNTIPRTKPSANQYLIRSINPVLQAGWRALTTAQQKIWNDWPISHGIMNAHGDKKPLSGHSLWMKLQFILYFYGIYTIFDPFTALAAQKFPWLFDGNTFAFYDYLDTSTIVKDSLYHISKWSDKLNSGHDLLQPLSAKQPLLTPDGVLLDGIDDFMQTATFPLIEPVMIYFVGRQITWSDQRLIFDGFNDYSGILYQRGYGGGSPLIDAYNRNFVVNIPGADNEFILNTFAIIKLLFNSNASTLQVNNLTTYTGGGHSVMNGFTLGINGALTQPPCHIETKGIVIRTIKDSTAFVSSIYNSLFDYYSL